MIFRYGIQMDFLYRVVQFNQHALDAKTMLKSEASFRQMIW